MKLLMTDVFKYVHRHLYGLVRSLNVCHLRELPFDEVTASGAARLRMCTYLIDVLNELIETTFLQYRCGHVLRWCFDV